MLNNFSDFLSLTSNLMVKYSNEDTSKLSETLLIAQLLRIEWKLDKLESGEHPLDGSSIQVKFTTKTELYSPPTHYYALAYESRSKHMISLLHQFLCCTQSSRDVEATEKIR